MANKLIIKRSSVAAKIPLASDLEVGEIAINLSDQKLYSKNAAGTVILVGQGAIWENANSITANYTIGSNNNAMSVGPITISSGAMVTVPVGSVWKII